ncbi:NnrS family protein [Rhodoblastus sp.]|jgi:uncharacterized protein involved in response to NO|uniref:NnrS family protein n=1 Tax=Rhodoblastus sp. TaxID=1962975 RepID=UPI0025CF9B42|nr:NnrS family protein [Rhodoblastus sp.]
MTALRATLPAGRTPPFVPFFALAALDAIFGGGAWLLTFTGAEAPQIPFSDFANWHSREMLFGYLAAALSGFFLTALPRWTGRPVPLWSVRAILAMWLAARVAPLPPNPFAVIAAAPGIALAVTAAFQVGAARDVRNAKTVALLGLYAGAGACCAGAAAGPARDLAMRLAIAAMIGLVMIVGGRVLPALTIRYDALCGEAPLPHVARTIERFSAAWAAAALVSWLVIPDGGALAIVLGCAAIGQILRMAGWLGRRTASSPPLRILYIAYASIPAGFALLAAHAFAPELIPESAGFHMWMVGSFGGMTLAIMSSMIRKRNNLAFTTSRAGAATALFWLAATLCRIAAAFVPSPAGWLIAAAIAWAAAFGLFLFDFRAALLRGLFTR